jgi:hypothetical protein
VQYTVTSESATGGTKPGAGVDFKLKSGTLTFTVGASGKTAISKTISVTVFGDATAESDETFAVTLSNPIGGGYGLGRRAATGTILNDDGIAPGITLGVGDGSIVVASSGSQSINLPVTLSAPSTSAVSVDYVVSPGSAAFSTKASGGGDFGGKLSGTLTFAVGASGKTGISKMIARPIWPDAAGDTDESFTITLSNLNATGVTLVRTTGTGSILGQP